MTVFYWTHWKRTDTLNESRMQHILQAYQSPVWLTASNLHRKFVRNSRSVIKLDMKRKLENSETSSTSLSDTSTETNKLWLGRAWRILLMLVRTGEMWDSRQKSTSHKSRNGSRHKPHYASVAQRSSLRHSTRGGQRWGQCSLSRTKRHAHAVQTVICSNGVIFWFLLFAIIT